MTKEMCGPRPIAHRGCVSAAPENTMPAFRTAVQAGCCVEMDIRCTADGQVVVFHDDTLARLTQGNPGIPADRRIREFMWEDLKQVRLPYAGHLLRYFPQNGFSEEEWYYYPWEFDRPEAILQRAWDFRELSSGERIARLTEDYRADLERAFAQNPQGEPIPSLEEFLLWVDEQPEFFYAEIEFKEVGLCPEVFQLLEKTGTAGRCILMSGVPEYLREIQHYAASHGKPEGLRMGANIRFCRPDLLRQIEGYDLYEVGLNAGCFDAGDVRFFHERGIQVFSNLGDTPAWWLELQTNGAAGFKTNCTAPYFKWLAQYG